MANESPSTAEDASRPIALEEELRKNPDLLQTDILLLHEWADKRPYLPKVLDRELALFLHSCYYSVEAAKAKLDTYFTTRTHLPEFFSQRDPLLPEIQTAARVVAYVTLPNATPDGYKVILIRPVDVDPYKFIHTDITKVFAMVVDLWLLVEGTAPGHVIVFDMEGVSFGHFTKLSIITFKKFFFYLQEALPFRLKGLHFFNVVPFMDKMMGMMKPFMKKELYDVMYIHMEGIDSLVNHIPKEILPEDYGGSAPCVAKLHERTLPTLLANRSYFLEEEKRAVDEAQRPGRARSADELFGIEGTFKKLDID